MANLRDIRLRMRSIGQTLQVTKAMKLISSAKLRKGRMMLKDTEPYFERIQKTMFDILSSAEIIESDYFRKNIAAERSHTAIIVVTSDKGLAGGYNVNVYRQVNALCAKVRNPLLILIGAVGYRYFAHTNHLILENFSFDSQIPTLQHAGEISDYLVSQYLWGLFDEIHIVYTHMFSPIRMRPIEHQVIPLVKEKIQDDLLEIGEKKRESLKFEFIPSVEAVIDILVPLYIKGVIYGAMVEAYASEQSARMVAMDEASKNAEELLATLKLNYNRARQAGITQEISEIIGGTAALAEK